MDTANAAALAIGFSPLAAYKAQEYLNLSVFPQSIEGAGATAIGASAVTLLANYFYDVVGDGYSGVVTVGLAAGAGHLLGGMFQSDLMVDGYSLLDGPRGTALGTSLALGYMSLNPGTQVLAYTAGVTSVLSFPIHQFVMNKMSGEAGSFTTAAATGALSAGVFWGMSRMLSGEGYSTQALLILGATVAGGVMLEDKLAMNDPNSIFAFPPSIMQPAAVALGVMIMIATGA
jgi:hypothetical protein